MEEEKKDKKSLKDNLISAAKQFLTSPKAKSILINFAQSQGVPIDEAVVLVDDAKAVRKLVNDNTPVITTFTTRGRISNKQTSQPEEGVEVKPVLALFPMKQVIKTRIVKKDDKTSKKNIFGKYKQIKEKVKYIDYEYDKEGDNTIKTDSNGEYQITFGVPTLPSIKSKNLPILVKPIVLYTKEGLAPDYQTLITQNSEVLGELPIKQMIDIDSSSKELAIRAKALLNAVAERAALIGLTAAETALLSIKGRILSFASNIQSKLLPLAISLLVIFGITKLAAKNDAQEIEEGRCPDGALLKQAIKTRNSVVKQINQIWIVIAANTAIAALLLYLTAQLKTMNVTISSLAFPLAVPPGVGVPYSLVAKLEDIKELFKEFGEINKDLRKAMLIALIFLLISLILILKYLKKIDGLIEKCATEGDITMAEINDELLNLQQSDEEQGSPLIKIVNGFVMNVVQDPKSQVGDLYRRYATATNSQGVVILKGEPSFSAVDQILIDELAFYIVQNNLKAD